jgi:hypothetical protein
VRPTPTPGPNPLAPEGHAARALARDVRDVARTAGVHWPEALGDAMAARWVVLRRGKKEDEGRLTGGEDGGDTATPARIGGDGGSIGDRPGMARARTAVAGSFPRKTLSSGPEWTATVKFDSRQRAWAVRRCPAERRSEMRSVMGTTTAALDTRTAMRC